MTHSIRYLALIAATLAASGFPGASYAAGYDESAILQSVEAVVAEHKIYATCFSLDSTAYQIVQENWLREVKQGAETLKGLNPSVAFMARFAYAVNPTRLLDEGMTISAAMAYCQKNEQQARKFHEFGFSHLADAIDQASKR